MQKNGFAVKTAAGIATGLAAAIVGLAAPAAAVPAPTESAQQTIDELRAQGYQVIVNRQSSKPLTEATVVGVRQGQDLSRVWIADGAADTGRTVYVDVN